MGECTHTWTCEDRGDRHHAKYVVYCTHCRFNLDAFHFPQAVKQAILNEFHPEHSQQHQAELHREKLKSASETAAHGLSSVQCLERADQMRKNAQTLKADVKWLEEQADFIAEIGRMRCEHQWQDGFMAASCKLCGQMDW